MNQYVILKQLGIGASSVVVQAMIPDQNDDALDAYFAMKIYKRAFLNKNQNQVILIQELNALKKLTHPNIIQLHEIIDDPKEDKVYLVMDLLEGGTVED